MRFFTVLMATLLVSACSNVPVAIKDAPTPDLQINDMRSGSAAEYQGAMVRWGGQIVKVENDEQGATVHIAQFPLNGFGRPQVKEGQDGGGRFIAITPEFVDPAIYKQGTLVTVAGPLVGEQTVTIDKKMLKVPVIQIKESYRWLNYSNRNRGYGPGYYDPFYDPFYYSPSWYWRSSWRYRHGYWW